MRFILFMLLLLMIQCVNAQNISYSISVPNGGRAGVTQLPTQVDTNHYYSYREINNLAKPNIGWSSYYQAMGELSYPETAKNQKIQCSLIIGFKIDEKGEVVSVTIGSFQEDGKWGKCADCETLIIDFFKNIQWIPGHLHHKNVKTINYEEVQFTIYDPDSKEVFNPFE